MGMGVVGFTLPSVGAILHRRLDGGEQPLLSEPLCQNSQPRGAVQKDALFSRVYASTDPSNFHAHFGGAKAPVVEQPFVWIRTEDAAPNRCSRIQQFV
jgi:hypothetical protein